MRKFPNGERLLVATHNPGKLEEIAALFGSAGPELVSMADYGLPSPEETETTFAGNARLKALAAARATGLVCLADDSGLEVDALDLAPGIHTADWAETPDGRDFDLAMNRVHRELERSGAAEPWTARFVCALVLAWPDGHSEECVGKIEGQIIWPGRGREGHGYDPIFLPDGHDKTFGEMERWEKNAMSHRGRAFERLMSCFT